MYSLLKKNTALIGGETKKKRVSITRKKHQKYRFARDAWIGPARVPTEFVVSPKRPCVFL